MQGIWPSFAAIEVSVLSATPAMSTCTWKAPPVQSSGVTLRGRTLRFWKRSSTRARAPGSASATTRRRKRDNWSEHIKPIPHTQSGLSPYLVHPALSEGRAGNEPARVYERFHSRQSMPAFEVIVTLPRTARAFRVGAGPVAISAPPQPRPRQFGMDLRMRLNDVPPEPRLHGSAVCAVLVTYHPDPALPLRLSRISPQVGPIALLAKG